MSFKAILILTLIIGSYAFPAEDDLSIFFDHTDASSRIIGGSPAGSVPHMVALVIGTIRILLCGGSLVTNRHVLTAAHCITPVQIGGGLVSSLRGILGTNQFRSGGTQIEFGRAIIHPSYNSNPIRNDIAVVVLPSNINSSPIIKPVPLMGFGFDDWADAGVATSASGWGRTRAGGSISQDLLTVDAEVIDGERCVTEVARRAAELNIRNAPPVDPNLEVCTFGANRQRICNGDSGSALIRRDNGQQIGVISWGLPCALGAPEMSVRVSAYAAWLEENLS